MLCICGEEKALYNYVERRRLCTCGEKALYLSRGEGCVYVERRRPCICGEEKAL